MLFQVPREQRERRCVGVLKLLFGCFLHGPEHRGERRCRRVVGHARRRELDVQFAVARVGLKHPQRAPQRREPVAGPVERGHRVGQGRRVVPLGDEVDGVGACHAFAQVGVDNLVVGRQLLNAW